MQMIKTQALYITFGFMGNVHRPRNLHQYNSPVRNFYNSLKQASAFQSPNNRLFDCSSEG